MCLPCISSLVLHRHAHSTHVVQAHARAHTHKSVLEDKHT